MQRLLDGPQRFLAMGGLDQDQTGRIEAERIEAMAIKPAIKVTMRATAISTEAMGRGDADQQARLRQARRKRQ